MNLGKILMKAGGSILKNIIPGIGLAESVIDLVNGFLPEEKKLPSTATGTEIQRTIDTLPPEKRMELMSKELDVEIVEAQEWTKTMSVLADADKAGASTRPKIALMMAETTCFAIITSISIWAYAVALNHVSMMSYLKECWPLLLAILGTPTALLRAYFAMRMKEKKSRYEMVGAPKGDSVFESIVKVFKK